MSVKDKAYITAMHRGSLAVSRDRAMTQLDAVAARLG